MYLDYIKKLYLLQSTLIDLYTILMVKTGIKISIIHTKEILKRKLKIKLYIINII